MKKFILFLLLLVTFCSFAYADICSNNPTNYLFYDDFEDGSVNASKITISQVGGTVTESGGGLYLNSTNSSATFDTVYALMNFSTTANFTIELVGVKAGAGTSNQIDITYGDQTVNYNNGVGFQLREDTNEIESWISSSLFHLDTWNTNSNNFTIFINSSGTVTYNNVISHTGVRPVFDINALYMQIRRSQVGLNFKVDLIRAYNGNVCPFDASFVYPTPPTGTRNNTNTGVVINATCLSGNVTLWFDQNANPITVVYNNFSPISNWNTTAAVSGTYYYKASCDSGLTNSTIRTWIYDANKPNLILNGGNFFGLINNTYISRVQSNKNLSFNITDDTLLYGFEINITNSTGNTWYYLLNTTTTGTLQTIIKYINYSNWTLGNYTIYLGVGDSHTDFSLAADYDIEKKPNSLKFITPEKNTIEIITREDSVVDTVKSTDRYSFNFDYVVKGETEKVFTLKSASNIRYIPESKYNGHFIIQGERLSGNWIDFENEEKQIPIIKEISKNEYTITFAKLGDKITFNSIGGLNEYNVSYQFQLQSISPFNLKVYIGNQIYYNGYNEFINASISGNISYLNSIISSGCVCINCSIVGTNCRIPIKYYSDASSNLSTKILNISLTYGIDNCSNNFGIPSNATALNISFYDQIDNSKINADWKGIFNYNTYYNYNFSNIAQQNDSFCIYPAWFNSTITGQIFYSKTDYVSKIYYIQNTTTLYLTNQTQNLNLYLISLTNSTTVKITWLTDNYIGVSGILFTYQCSGDGTKILIETSPIISGDSFVNINLLNSLYSYSVLYNGVLYTNNDTYSKCHIENTNLISYFISTGGGTISPELSLNWITCNISKSGANSVYMSWSDNPYSGSIITGCLFSYRNGINGKILIDSACENGSSINRTIPDTGYTYDVIGKIYQNGYSKPCSGSISFNLDNTSAKLFGITGLFCVAFLIISMALFWAGDDIRQQVGGIIGIIIAWLFGLLAFDWAEISAMCFFIIIIMIVGRSATKR